MSTPLISVVMPVYNAADYLDAAVNSIRTQTLADFEFIIVNDGSTDASPDILQRHAAEDRRIRILNAEHQGQVAAMRLGFAEARGEYVARADSDDISLPNRFALQADYLFKHLGVAVVGASVELIDQHGIIFDRVTYPTTSELCRQCLMRYWSCIPHSVAMIRKEAYEAIGGFRKVFAPAEDYDFWLRMSETAGIANVPYYLLQYRVHFANLSFRKTEKQLLSVLAARRAAQLRAEGKPDPFNDDGRLDWKTLEQIGCSGEDVANGVGSFTTYVEWGVALGNESAALSLFHSLLRALGAQNNARAADIVVWLVGKLVHNKRRWLALKYSLLAMQLRPGFSIVAKLLHAIQRARREANSPIALEIAADHSSNETLRAGYVDRVTPIDNFGLVIEGWSPLLPSVPKLIVRTNLRVGACEVRRKKREDVATAHGEELLMSGFLATLYYEEPVPNAATIEVLSSGREGERLLEMCCEVPLRRYDWSISKVRNSCFKAAESKFFDSTRKQCGQ